MACGFHRRVAKGLQFFEINLRASSEAGVGKNSKNAYFRPMCRSISETVGIWLAYWR